MPISNKLSEGLTEVDVIICGGGTAACVVAGRLAEADPNLSILVIEGGENNEGKYGIRNGALLAENLTPTSRTAIFCHGQKSNALAGRTPVVATGGILGGGSSINIMLYSRAQGSDFDSWNSEGWSTKEMIPFMKKLENYHGKGTNESTHGYDGPIHITNGSFKGTKSADDLISAATRLGYTEYQDLQDPEQVNNGWERAVGYVTSDGARADAAHAYVHPLLNDDKHPNLHVLCESKVNRVLFDENKRAVGVEYLPNPAYQPLTNASKATRSTIKARKLVVISCGACGTPSVLERSGVGDPETLQKASVPVIANVPGVGDNYDEHTLILYPFTTNLEPEDTQDAFWKGDISRAEAERTGRLGWNACDVHWKLRPTEDEVVQFPAELKAIWERDFKNVPDRPFIMGSTLAGFPGDPATVPRGQYFTMGIYSAYPYSRGHLHITGANWEDPTDFDPGYFTDPDDIDIKTHIWAYKKIRAVFRSTDMYTGEVEAGHPRFPQGSKAANASNTCSRDVVAFPEYSNEDDKGIEQCLRENIGSCWHSLGTAKMAPRQEKGVVDSKLNVYGVQGLKCVDLSICPHMVAANTCNTAYVVGEKGADIIMAELGLKK